MFEYSCVSGLVHNGGSSFACQDLYKAMDASRVNILTILENVFDSPLLKLTYYSSHNWHLGIIPQSLNKLSADEGREIILGKIKQFIPDFVIAPEEHKARMSVHIQKLPSFIPKEGDKGIHITVGMNDVYLEKEGRSARNFDILNVIDDVTFEKLEKGIVLDGDNPFSIKKFGFLTGNETNMDMCNGRTMFVAVMNEVCDKLVADLRLKYLESSNKVQKTPHITLAYLSYKDEQGNWAHEEWNQAFCPMKKQEEIIKGFYHNPTYYLHWPLPHLVINLFNAIKTEEEAIALKNLLEIEYKE